MFVPLHSLLKLARLTKTQHRKDHQFPLKTDSLKRKTVHSQDLPLISFPYLEAQHHTHMSHRRTDHLANSSKPFDLNSHRSNTHNFQHRKSPGYRSCMLLDLCSPQFHSPLKRTSVSNRSRLSFHLKQSRLAHSSQ